MSMQYRITISVALGLAVILAVFAYFGITAVGQSKDAAAQERLVWARAMAAHVDDVLRRSLGLMEHMAFEVAAGWTGEGSASALSQGLPEHFREHLYSSRLALFAADGSLAWSDPPPEQGDLPSFRPVVASAAASLPPSLSPCAAAADEPAICLAVPVSGAGGELLGILAAQLDPRQPELHLFHALSLGEGAHIELVTDSGQVVAADRLDLVGASPHVEVLNPFMSSGQAGVVEHKMPSDSPVKSHIVAYAPINLVPGWGVAVEQERDVALAAASSLQKKLVWFGLLTLFGAALLAWLDVRRVVRPLRSLTATASHMAGGNLETPIALARRDEVGTLARAFESMRTQLKGSLEELEQRDRELEERVRERTREVQELYEELQRRDEVRVRLLDKVISAQEEERGRIARELHDEAGQSLTAIVMSLEAAELSSTADSQAATERLARAKALALATIEEIRKLVVDLRPAALDDLGLIPALRAYAESRLADSGVEVELETDGLRDRLPPHLEATLFRVAQEALTNVVRHAEAKTARVRLLDDNGRLTLTIEDDGKGFAAAAVLASADQANILGLLGMQERVALCGGSLTVESAPGKGTRVRAEIPLPEDGDG